MFHCKFLQRKNEMFAKSQDNPSNPAATESCEKMIVTRKYFNWPHKSGKKAK